MKFSNNLIGALIFTILAVVVFVFMAMRPAVEGDAMIFGMPTKTGNIAEVPVPAATETAETKTDEVSEPVKKEEVDATSVPATPEEAPVTTPAPAEAPATSPVPSEAPVTNPVSTEAPVINPTPTTEGLPATAPATESMSEPSSVPIPSGETAAPTNQ